ncbi:MAG: hypothetical protein WAS73_18055 [Defluviicoccus sp.]
MTPVEIAALLNAISVIGRLALEAVTEMKTGGLTEAEIARAWAQMQARLERADTLWRHGAQPASQPAAPAASPQRDGEAKAASE